MARIQIELSAKEAARLNHMMDVCDFQTKKELFGNAFAALEWMVREKQVGRDVFSQGNSTDEKYYLQLPALQNVQQLSNLTKDIQESHRGSVSRAAIEKKIAV
ncbi:MAG: hypothetical protein GVY31_09085 [Alphaproteobacteria bacterium]|jgi:hypothetical protein|nr:hypothetical protein [Alphaproteobacteria bacterium]